MSQPNALREPVALDTGLVRGIPASHHELHRDVTVFRGIPFAAPPVGPLRWRAPQPAASWDGVRVCDTYGDAPAQTPVADDSIMRQFSFATPRECGISEDCLTLNVWSGATSAEAKLPVIVWIYGGGHRVGSASHPVSDGSHLAGLGAVVIAVNYRLGAMGYFAHPALSAEEGASGHYAVLDILAALQWVQRNAAAFGGDPSCVTLFGQSAGAALAGVVAASPSAAGLFHRVIVHSSGRFQGGPMGQPMPTLAQAEAAGAALIEKQFPEIARIADPAALAARLRELPPNAIAGPRGFWTPIVDGVALPASVSVQFKRGQAHVTPVLAGYTENESAPYAQLPQHTVDGFVAHARDTFGDQADALLALYPHATDRDAAISSYHLRRDNSFAYQPWQYACHAARSGERDTFVFNFRKAPPMPSLTDGHEPTPPHGWGAYHGAELWYVFNTLGQQPWSWQPQDAALADAMAQYWVAFARSGTPQVEGLPAWPAFRPDDAEPQAMHFGDGETSAAITSGALLNQPALTFHEAFYHGRKTQAAQ